MTSLVVRQCDTLTIGCSGGSRPNTVSIAIIATFAIRDQMNRSLSLERNSFLSIYSLKSYWTKNELFDSEGTRIAKEYRNFLLIRKWKKLLIPPDDGKIRWIERCESTTDLLPRFNRYDRKSMDISCIIFVGGYFLLIKGIILKHEEAEVRMTIKQTSDEEGIIGSKYFDSE